jgi:general secretion pathway protein G
MIKAKAPGMSILEIMIYISIVGIFFAMLGPKIKDAFAKVDKFKTESTIQTIQNGLRDFNLHTDRFPTTSEGLEALLEEPSNTKGDWKGPYITVKNDQLPKDAWGQDFEYNSPPTEFVNKYKRYEIISLGKDTSNPGSMIDAGE